MSVDVEGGGQAVEGGLDERIEALARRMTSKAQAFAEAVARGASKRDAAKAAGLSFKGGAPWRVLDRPDVAELVALLRERAGRDARVTLESQIARFQVLGRAAEEAGDVSAAIAAEREVSKLSNLYPDARVTVQHELAAGSFTPAEFELAARLVHEARPLLEEHPVIEADFEPVTVPGDHEAPLPQARAGDSASQDRRKEGSDHAA